MSAYAFFDSTDLVSDFNSFVAANRGISCDEAAELIVSWLKEYRPTTAARIDLLSSEALLGDAPGRAGTLG
jgi:hypothetical protein